MNGKTRILETHLAEQVDGADGELSVVWAFSFMVRFVLFLPPLIPVVRGQVLAWFSFIMRFRELRVEASELISDHAVVAPGLVFRWTAHHVREIFSALLPKGYALDGSSVIQVTCGPRGDEPQYHQCLGSSEYYVEDFDFVSYASADPSARERVVLATVEAALCDIADRVGVDKTVVRSTASGVIECGFRLSTEIRKLRKALRPSGLTLRVIRCLASDLGETWVARVVRRDGAVIAEEVMGETPDYPSFRTSPF